MLLRALHLREGLSTPEVNQPFQAAVECLNKFRRPAIAAQEPPDRTTVSAWNAPVIILDQAGSVRSELWNDLLFRALPFRLAGRFPTELNRLVLSQRTASQRFRRNVERIR
jgi:hypothetical protein